MVTNLNNIKNTFNRVELLHNELYKKFGENYKRHTPLMGEIEHLGITLTINFKKSTEKYIKINYISIEGGVSKNINEKKKTWVDFLNLAFNEIEKEMKLRHEKMLSVVKKKKIEELETMSIKAFTNQHIKFDEFGVKEHQNGININFENNSVSVSRPKRMKWNAEKNFRCLCDLKFDDNEYKKFLSFLKELKND